MPPNHEWPTEHTIVLSPELGITPEQFMEQWNQLDECRKVAQANTQRDRGPLGESAVVILEGVLSGVISNYLYDMIKYALSTRRVRVKVEDTGPDRGKLIVEALPEEAG